MNCIGAPLAAVASLVAVALEAFLGRDAQRARFAIHAGMHDERGAPIGLYISGGDEAHALSLTDGPGNFHMKPNGVFWQGADGGRISTHRKNSRLRALWRGSPRSLGRCS